MCGQRAGLPKYSTPLTNLTHHCTRHRRARSHFISAAVRPCRHCGPGSWGRPPWTRTAPPLPSCVLFLLMDRVLADVAAAHEALFTPDVLAAKQFLVAVFQELRTVTPRGTPWELVLAKHLRACTPAEVGLSPYASLARSLALLTLDRARELRAREEARARAVHAARAACVAQACAQVPGWDTVFPTMADAVKHLRESGTDDRGSTAAASELKRAVTTGGAAGALKRREREPDSPPFWAALADVESLEPALMRWCK